MCLKRFLPAILRGVVCILLYIPVNNLMSSHYLIRLISISMLLVCSIALRANELAGEPQSSINILVVDIVMDDMPSFLQGESILDIDNFDRPGSRRDLVDYVLLMQSLVLGGISASEIRTEKWGGVSYDRMLLRMSDAEAVVFSNTIWREDVGEDHPTLFVSAETLKKGQYFAGIYMNPENPKFSQKLDFSQMTAVSSHQWRPDWNALNKLPLKHLYNTVNWEHMFKMVYIQRVDFMLIAFPSTTDLTYSAIGLNLKPKPNLKVELDGSRGWVISKNHPQGFRVKQAVDRGLVTLHKMGRVKRAYEAAGVIHPGVEGWNVIKPDDYAADVANN